MKKKYDNSELKDVYHAIEKERGSILKNNHKKGSQDILDIEVMIKTKGLKQKVNLMDASLIDLFRILSLYKIINQIIVDKKNTNLKQNLTPEEIQNIIYDKQTQEIIKYFEKIKEKGSWLDNVSWSKEQNTYPQEQPNTSSKISVDKKEKKWWKKVSPKSKKNDKSNSAKNSKEKKVEKATTSEKYKNKTVRNMSLIDTRYKVRKCSEDAQRKAKEYFAVEIPWWDGSALKTRNSYDKALSGKKAKYLTYEKINPAEHSPVSWSNYKKYFLWYISKMKGDFFDILMESKTSPSHWHRVIWFRSKDGQIYIIDNAAKDKKMKAWPVLLSYYIDHFVSHGYPINGIWNYDTNYTYV